MALSPGGPTPISVVHTVDLLPSSYGCTAKKSATVCTVTLDLSAGRWTAVVTTYDRIAGRGNELAKGSLSFRVNRGTIDDVPFDVAGVPAGISVIPGGDGVAGTHTSGFTFYSRTASLIVNAADADGYPILGLSGATYALSVTSGSGWSVAPASASSPNSFAVTPPATNGAIAQLQASVTVTGCAPSACTVSFSAGNVAQLMFVAPYGQSEPVYVLAPPYTGTPVALQGAVGGYALATNSSGDLFVVENANNGTMLEYAPPYTSGPIATIPVPDAAFIAVDTHDKVYVSEGSYQNPSPGIAVFAPPYGTTPSVLIPNVVSSLAFDGSGDLFAAQNQAIVEYSPPFSSSSTPVVTLSTSGYGALPIAVDSHGNVLAGSAYQADLLVYRQPLANGAAPSSIISLPTYLPKAFAFDGSGNVFVAQSTLSPSGSTGGVSAFPSSYPSTPSLWLGGPAAKSIALDQSRNLYILGGGFDTNLYVAAPPYTKATTLQTGLGGGTSYQALLLAP